MATEIISDTPAQGPPLLLLYSGQLSAEQRNRLRADVDHARTNGKVLVIEAGFTVFHLTPDGWKRLDPTPTAHEAPTRP